MVVFYIIIFLSSNICESCVSKHLSEKEKADYLINAVTKEKENIEVR